MTKEEQINVLSECVLVEVLVGCEKCRKTDGNQFMDELDFAEELYKKGWRYKNEKCLCPKCVKSKIK